MMLRRIVIASLFSALTLAPVSAGLINNQLNQGWASYRDLTSSAILGEVHGVERRRLPADRCRCLPERQRAPLQPGLGEELRQQRLGGASRPDERPIRHLLE